MKLLLNPPNSIIILLGGFFMYVKCYELMKIPTFQSIQLVAGELGLNRLVSWVYVLTTPSLEEWVHGGELIFVVTHDDIKKLLKDAVSHQIAGVVVLKNKENESLLDDEMIDFANKEKLPLFEMDYNIKLLDVTKDISAYIIQRQEKVDYIDYFFHNILFAEHLEKKNIDDFTLHYGFHSENLFFIATIHSKDYSKLTSIHVLMERYIGDINVRFLMMNLNSYLVILACTTSDTVKKAKTLLKSSFTMINEKFPDLLLMGIGDTCDSLYDIRNSYTKSMKSIDLCTGDKRIVDYGELGFSRLLLSTIDEVELEEYANYILGPVKDYDEIHESFFLKTMEVYVLCNGNVSKTSSQLYIHRNTCVYRIAKINELFDIDIDNPYTRAEILNCLSIYRFLGQIE